MTDSMLGDTNVLLRFAHSDAAGHEVVLASVDRLIQNGHRIVYAPQSLREFWNVSTRPTGVNGFGLSIAKADAAARLIETNFTLLHDEDSMHTLWRRLVVQHEVKGVQVHDARPAASALVGGCRAILTLNDPNFKRFGVPALHPSEVPAFLASA